MDGLLQLLQDILSSEYAQWMRYTYLASLGYGLETDSLSREFEMHAYDELHHANQVRRWIVDLGGIPNTVVPPVEQFQGSVEDAINWLIAAEVIGINKYNQAWEMAAAIGIPGLQSQLGHILEKEHEHLSELMDYVEPHMMSGEDDTVLVVVADHFRRSAQFNPIAHTRSIEKHADSLEDYLKNLLQSALYHYVYEYSPQKGYEYVTQEIEKNVKDLWSRRKTENVEETMQFYKTLYDWMNSVKSSWPQLHDSIMPDWKEWLWSDIQREMNKETDQPNENLSMEDIFKQLNPKQKTAPTSAPGTAPESKPEAPKEQPAATQPEREVRRPIEKSIEEKVKVRDPSTPKNETPTMEVDVGDTVYNQTIARELKTEGGASAAEANKRATGKIEQIKENGELVVNVAGESQIWNPRHEVLWGSRERGQRTVQSLRS